MQNKSDMDLSGKLIIKVQLDDDIRRIPIHNEAITYDELLLMMQRVFQGKLAANDDITIKYKDEDGDLITIFDSSDLSYAAQCSRILKLQILKNCSKMLEPEVKTQKINDVAGIKLQLRKIRDQVNHLLDVLDFDRSKPSQSSSTEDGNEQEQVSNGQVLTTNSTVNKVNSSEFDPLQEKAGPNEVTRKESTSSMGNISGNPEVPENRPQSVPVNPAMPVAPNAAVSASPTTQNALYNRAGPAGYTYRSMGYPPQQYSAYGQPGYGQVEQPDPSAYMSGMYSQNQQTPQTYTGQPPMGYPPQTAPNNPYSKSFTPTAQHYMSR